jgi:hypothetical protein
MSIIWGNSMRPKVILSSFLCLHYMVLMTVLKFSLDSVTFSVRGEIEIRIWKHFENRGKNKSFLQ